MSDEKKDVKSKHEEEIESMMPLTEAALEDVVNNTDMVLKAYVEQLDGVNAKAAFVDAFKRLLYDKGERTAFNPAFESASSIRDGFAARYRECEFCHHHTDPEMWKSEDVKETTWEQTRTDCGWGDDDCFANVTRLNTYEICPDCGHREKVRSWHLSTGPEKTRSQLRSERDSRW